ncbi:MAG: hypothetical protein M3Z26_12155 [Bacteroidota bacterium]|nr:hypothetical protein [Bacteroidota bacterium]
MSCHTEKEKETFSIQKDSLAEEKKATNSFEQIHHVKKLVKSGDLILRTGKDFTSELMRRLSLHDKTYSHCGIASWEKDTLFVYHALGGEWNPNQKLRRDPFELFCNPYENRGFGIFRYSINVFQEKEIINLAHQYYQQGVMFDMKFDLATDDRMYCSEFLYKVIKNATKDSLKLNTTTLNNIQFVAVDNLFFNRNCHEIKRVVFQ